MNKTEYQEEYCGMRGKGRGGGGGAGGKGGPPGLTPCKYTEDIQPVGGRVQAKFRAEVIRKRQEAKEAANTRPYPVKDEGFPTTAYDGDYVAGKVDGPDYGANRTQPKWRDANANAACGPIRVEDATANEVSEGDAKKRKQLYTYQSTRDNAPTSGYVPITAPDIHKFRYMHGNYMTRDDWYN